MFRTFQKGSHTILKQGFSTTSRLFCTIQYCNFFPEERRYPEGWGTDRLLVLAGDGQRMLVDHRASMENRILSGKMFQEYEGDLFVAQYGGPRGDIISLSRPRQTQGARLQYQLCPSWLDNHFFMNSDEPTLAAGTRWEMDLTIELAPATSVDEDIEARGRRALETGAL